MNCGSSVFAKSCSECPAGDIEAIDNWCAGDCRPYPPFPQNRSDDFTFDNDNDYDDNILFESDDYVDIDDDLADNDETSDVASQSTNRFDTIRTLKNQQQICRSKYIL